MESKDTQVRPKKDIKMEDQSMSNSDSYPYKSDGNEDS